MAFVVDSATTLVRVWLLSAVTPLLCSVVPDMLALANLGRQFDGLVLEFNSDGNQEIQTWPSSVFEQIWTVPDLHILRVLSDSHIL